MRVTSARPKPMPIPKTSRDRWLSAVLWLLFCAAIVAVALFLTPRIGAMYTVDEAGAPLWASIDDGLAVPMAATVLYPNEPEAAKH